MHSGQVRRMQLALAERAHMLAYGIDGYLAGDATETLLQGLSWMLGGESEEARRECWRWLGGKHWDWRCRPPQERQ